MAVQTAACARRGGHIYAVHVCKSIDRHARAEGDAAVVATRAESSNYVLRAIGDRMRIRSTRQRCRRSIRAATYGLVVNTGGLAGTLCRQPCLPVVVGK